MNNDHIERVKKELDLINAGRWSLQYVQLQDGGNFILVAIEVNKKITQSELSQVREDIREVLKAIVVVSNRDKDYAWQVVIKRRA